MSDAGSFAAQQNGTPEALRGCVDEAAMRSVLGGLDDAERIALFENIRAEAEQAGSPQVARLAAGALESAGSVSGAQTLDELFSTTIADMQLALAGGPQIDRSAEAKIPSAAASCFAPLGEDRELMSDFILESREHLSQVEVQMIMLEKDPGDAEAIHTVFRAFHTIKGLAGFLELDDVRDVAHETETLLDLARNRTLAVTPRVVDIVLASADFLKLWMKRLEDTLGGRDAGSLPEKPALLDRIRSAARGDSETVTPEAVTSSPTADAETLREDRSHAPAEGRERWNGEERREQRSEARCVKVDTAKLDFLVDMAGEMVIAQSMLRHHPELTELHSPAVLHSLSHLARITGDLQKTAMSMRMVPIGGLFQKMNRLVRDLARKTGKQAEMEAIGADTELDRNVVEELADPLMHMVRNAVDHGLETLEERRAAGKDATGRVRLRACHQAGHIVIEIADDGRGLNREAILAKARSKGLLDEGLELTDREIFSFIFHAGFSTAAEVTAVSGRGVGMDVVKKQIQKLRGHVEIDSVPGRGTSFYLRLPLTLAMIDGLVVGVGRERFVLPIFSVREMLRPTAEMIFSVEGRQEMALVRNNLLPIVRLYQRFAVEPRSQEPTESLLIVAEATGRTFCLMVDELIGKQEVVIKSLGETLKDIPGVAGGAILGDGRVGLILDLEGVFRGVAR